MRPVYLLGCLFILILTISPCAVANDRASFKEKQIFYVPAYSHIYIGNNSQKFFLTITLSIRNCDIKNSIKITKIDYYNSQGKLLKSYLKEPMTLSHLDSLCYVVDENDKGGGPGAKFIVELSADKSTHSPIIEAIMVGARSTQGISFISRGQEMIN